MTSFTLDLDASADDREVSKILYSRKDAAFALSISIRSFDAILARKEIKTTRLGKKVLVHWKELSKFAESSHAELTAGEVAT